MTRKTRTRVALAALGATATLFQFYPSGCGQYYFNGLVTAFDFCSVLNCTGASYFDLCEPVVLLIDCPNLVAANP